MAHPEDLPAGGKEVIEITASVHVLTCFPITLAPSIVGASIGGTGPAE